MLHLEKFSVEAMNNSAPVIRPLWMLDPHDPINQVKDDEFLIGDKVFTVFLLFYKTVYTGSEICHSGPG